MSATEDGFWKRLRPGFWGRFRSFPARCWPGTAWKSSNRLSDLPRFG